jgi:myo-inositol catabolism protein IolC
MFLLAMDHRDSLARDVYGIDGDVSAADAARISDGKRVVFEGLLAALDRGADRALAGVLVDERYGADVARSARAAGVALAMERSGEDFFVLEYGDGWLDHVAEFAPDYVKVLVRDNPDFAASQRDRQRRDLAEVSAALHEAERPFLFELLVPATDAQKSDRYDADLRPQLTIEVVTAMQDAGVEPDIWKIEGLETAEAAEAVVRAVRRDGRDDVRCIVLGRDAPTDKLDHWLTIAASVDGFTGFAIGRSIWEKPLTDLVAGHLDEATAITRIADHYRHFCEVYAKAS